MLISAVGGGKMKHYLIVGIFDVVVGLALIVLCIILGRTERIAFVFFPVAMGLGIIAAYISDKKQHKKQMAELAKKWGIKDE